MLMLRPAGVVCDVFVENGQLSSMVILVVMEFNKFIEHGGCVIGSNRWLGCGGGDLVCWLGLWYDWLGCGWDIAGLAHVGWQC